ncbi:MAG: N-acetyltransferase [Sphingobacteriales bacterium]|nr:MAG: N-acetyltransferase [Sphingobacteriales bacterium]
MTININENIVLELTAQKHAQGLLDAVNKNREHLSRFLPWVGNMQTVEDFKNYIQHCEMQLQQKTDISFVILANNTVAGRIGLHYIHPHNKHGAIGYWIAKEFEGQGIVLQSCKAVIRYGFDILGLHRIEIKAAVENTRSQAIPEKLGFFKEGILREAEFVNNAFTDIVLYSLLNNAGEK